jgi:hypothetical protein
MTCGARTHRDASSGKRTGENLSFGMKKLDSQVFVSEFFAQVWLMFLNDDQT